MPPRFDTLKTRLSGLYLHLGECRQCDQATDTDQFCPRGRELLAASRDVVMDNPVESDSATP